jgi:hypothetical protein
MAAGRKIQGQPTRRDPRRMPDATERALQRL